MGSLPKTRFFSTKLGFFTGPTICWVFEAPGIYMISPFETIAQIYSKEKTQPVFPQMSQTRVSEY